MPQSPVCGACCRWHHRHVPEPSPPNSVLGLNGYLLLATGYLAIMCTTFTDVFVMPTIVEDQPGYVGDVIGLASVRGTVTGDLGPGHVLEAPSGLLPGRRSHLRRRPVPCTRSRTVGFHIPRRQRSSQRPPLEDAQRLLPTSRRSQRNRPHRPRTSLWQLQRRPMPRVKVPLNHPSQRHWDDEPSLDVAPAHRPRPARHHPGHRRLTSPDRLGHWVNGDATQPPLLRDTAARADSHHRAPSSSHCSVPSDFPPAARRRAPGTAAPDAS